MALSYLGEGAAQFDVGRGRELSLVAHGERARLQAVQVGHDQQQVGGGLDGQEAAAGYVDAQGVVEALDGGADCCLQLDDVLPTIQRLVPTGVPVERGLGKTNIYVIT